MLSVATPPCAVAYDDDDDDDDALCLIASLTATPPLLSFGLLGFGSQELAASPRPEQLPHKSTSLLMLLPPRFRVLGSPSTGMIPITWMCGKLPTLSTPQNGTVGTKTAVRAEADEELD